MARLSSKSSQAAGNKWLDKGAAIALLSLLVGTAGGWVSARIETENRLTRVETTLESLQAMLKDIREDLNFIRNGAILFPVPSDNTLMERYDSLEDPAKSYRPAGGLRPGADPFASRPEE